MRPTVDISTFVAVESLFHSGTVDPWAHQMAGRLADIVAYAREIRVPWPTNQSYERAGCLPVGPGLLERLESADRALVVVAPYLADEIFTLPEDTLLATYRQFLVWARANRTRLRSWCDLHSRGWVREGHLARVNRPLLFSLQQLNDSGGLDQGAAAVGIPATQLAYAFDAVLRYPLYGSLTAAGERFLNHPIRDAILLPGMKHESAPPPVAITFSDSIRQLAPRLDEGQYVELLHSLRELVQEGDFHRLSPGSVEKDVRVFRVPCGQPGEHCLGA